MVLELSAQHLPELRPRHQRGQRHMRGDEALAIVVHELQQILLLLVVDRHFPVPHEEDRIHVAETRSPARRLPGGHRGLVRSDIGVGPDVGVPEPRFVPQAFDHRQCV